jgi:hypothetical protein
VIRNYFLVLGILIVIFPVVSADSVDQEIDELLFYAEQYELGNINYLELTLYSSLTRSRVNSLLGEVEFDHEQGLTEKAATSYFGNPQGYTNWVWSSKENNEIRSDEKVPYYERLVFDGHRVQISFNAWPHYYQSSGNNILYYWTDFEVRFKQNIDFDLDLMLSDMESSALEFKDGRISAEEIAGKAVQYDKTLQNYFDQNRENCKNTMKELFSGDFELRKENRIRWENQFYSGNNLDVKLVTQMQDCAGDCYWPWVDIWFEPEFYGHDLHWEESNSYFDPIEYEEYTIDGLEREIVFILSEARYEIYLVDKGISTWGNVRVFENKLRAVNEVLSRKYYDGKQENTESYDKRKQVLDLILTGYGGYEIQSITETGYEKVLAINKEERINAWCQELSTKKCDIRENICYKGDCTYALGGAENCENGIDDDGDSASDCDDPDCARECGRYCESICQDTGCWDCTGNCESACNTGCWDCDWENNQEYCSSLCDSTGCNSCQDSCYSSNICSECNKCQEDQYNYIEEETSSIECYNVCNNLVTTLEESDKCIKMCDENVVFYCNGEKQYTPCLNSTYSCADGKIQKFPCETFDCLFVKQSEPCANVNICGYNQKLQDNICVCADGYFDCDGTGSCSSTVSCGQSQEICDDRIDNDGDNSVDCQDYSSCDLKSCGSNSICYDGKCQLENQIEVCDEFEFLENGVCVSACEYDSDCSDFESCSFGICKELEVCEVDNDCISYDHICKSGTCSKLNCETGYKIQDKECIEQEDIFIEIPIATGEHCNVVSDCSGVMDICSNGLCKEIPIESNDNLFEEDLIEESYSETIPTADEDTLEEEMDEIEFEEAIEGIVEEPILDATGLFFFLTGYAISEDKNIPCNENQVYDEYSGNCWCDYGYFSCDGDWSGNDATGCESVDATCGGEREVCSGGCGENQYCDELGGSCMCNEGFYNCNGAWWGCESSTPCESCTSNSDCSAPACSNHDSSTVVNFGCFQGDTWTEEKGKFSFSGSCQEYPNGRIDGWVGFNYWGDPYDTIHEVRSVLELELGNSWCELERENALKQRKEIESSFSEGGIEWFQTRVIEESPNDWEMQVEAVYDMYWNIVENNRRLAETSKCMDKEFPKLQPFDISGETELSTIYLWEEAEYVEEFGITMLTPYMRVWIFPPKELIKEEMIAAAAQGRWPGDGGQAGPSPEDLEEIRSDPDALHFIENLVDKYDDGILNGNFKIADENGDLFNVDIRISEENLIEVTPVAVYDQNADITVEIDFDWMYSFIETQEKHPEVERPDWANKDFGDVLDDTFNNGRVAGKVGSGIATGKIKVTPITELRTAMVLIGEMFQNN